jgi:hypothetical protein
VLLLTLYLFVDPLHTYIHRAHTQPHHELLEIYMLIDMFVLEPKVTPTH